MLSRKIKAQILKRLKFNIIWVTNGLHKEGVFDFDIKNILF